MNGHRPASIRPEPALAPGVAFVEAAGRLCVWPISGAGADMVVCGEGRAEGSSYCAKHKQVSASGPGKRL